MKIDVQWAELLQLMISLLPQPGSWCQSDPIIHSGMFFSFLSSPLPLVSPSSGWIRVDPLGQELSKALGAQQDGHRAGSRAAPGGAELCPELLRGWEMSQG